MKSLEHEIPNSPRPSFDTSKGIMVNISIKLTLHWLKLWVLSQKDITWELDLNRRQVATETKS